MTIRDVILGLTAATLSICTGCAGDRSLTSPSSAAGEEGSTNFSKLTEPIGKFEFACADMPRSGYLALQDHWTPIWYRNIRLKRL